MAKSSSSKKSKKSSSSKSRKEKALSTVIITESNMDKYIPLSELDIEQMYGRCLIERFFQIGFIQIIVNIK